MVDRQERIIEEGFGPDMMQSDVRIPHENEGARLAREVLRPTRLAGAVIEEVATIIDGHDTRPHAPSLNDELVKDADKLWRFTVTGVERRLRLVQAHAAPICRPSGRQFALLETEAGRQKWRRRSWRRPGRP